MSICAAIKRDGGRCNAAPLPGETYCYNHHPEREEERKRNASKAGKRGGRGRGGKTSGEIPAIKGAILELVENVLRGDQDRGAAAVAGNLYNTLLRAIEVERRIRETEDLERRLDTLEERLATNGGKRWGA